MIDDDTRDARIVGVFFDALGDLDRLDATELLDQLGDADSDGLAMQLALLLHDQPPASIKRDLSLCQMLGVVVALIRGGHLDRCTSPTDLTGPDGVGAVAEALRDGALRGVYETRQQAAFAAVRQIGGATAFGVSQTLDAALSQRTRPANATTLDTIERLARTRHGWHIHPAPLCGYVLYRAAQPHTPRT